MLEIAVMIEGQNSLTWPRWKKAARTVEEAGFVGLYRSDHYTNPHPPDKASLELWVSLAWLASHTERIEFGPLVSPVSFRHPSMTARMAAAVDDLSGGRLTLGLGAGWQEREHEIFGWDLLDIPQRFDRFEEGLEIISRLLKRNTPSSYQGEYFQLREGILLPRPTREGGPPLLVGGNGIQRTLPLAARFADEWNGVLIPPGAYRERNQRLDELLRDEGREPIQVRRSLMTGCVFGRTEEEVERKVRERTEGEKDAQQLRDQGLVVGTGEDILAQLEEIEGAGAERVMLQWLDLDDLDVLQALAEAVLPEVDSPSI